jgi:diamine N-acetyltransferase
VNNPNATKDAAAVTLRDVDRHNFRQCIRLDVREEQRGFVATNVISIAQSKVEPECIPQAVYAGDEMVGFIMYGYDPEEREHFIGRVMIDRSHQGQGYGRAAVVEAIRRMRADPHLRGITLCIVPANEGAQRLYESLGFVLTGEVSESGELYMRLSFES